MVNQWPAEKIVKIGQRWLREDPDSGSGIVIEINQTSGKSIYGIIVQVMWGKKPEHSVTEPWCFNADDSPCIYTYLSGQDTPNSVC